MSREILPFCAFADTSDGMAHDTMRFALGVSSGLTQCRRRFEGPELQAGDDLGEPSDVDKAPRYGLVMANFGTVIEDAALIKIKAFPDV